MAIGEIVRSVGHLLRRVCWRGSTTEDRWGDSETDGVEVVLCLYIKGEVWLWLKFHRGICPHQDQGFGNGYWSLISDTKTVIDGVVQGEVQVKGQMVQLHVDWVAVVYGHSLVLSRITDGCIYRLHGRRFLEQCKVEDGGARTLFFLWWIHARYFLVRQWHYLCSWSKKTLAVQLSCLDFSLFISLCWQT